MKTPAEKIEDEIKRLIEKARTSEREAIKGLGTTLEEKNKKVKSFKKALKYWQQEITILEDDKALDSARNLFLLHGGYANALFDLECLYSFAKEPDSLKKIDSLTMKFQQLLQQSGSNPLLDERNKFRCQYYTLFICMCQYNHKPMPELPEEIKQVQNTLTALAVELMFSEKKMNKWAPGRRMLASAQKILDSSNSIKKRKTTDSLPMTLLPSLIPTTNQPYQLSMSLATNPSSFP